MNCPCCKTKTYVYSGYCKKAGYKRWRKCPNCGRRFNTLETYCSKDVLKAKEEMDDNRQRKQVGINN